MRTVTEIESDIAKVKEEMQDVHGSTTEVYARIVGYYRSVRNWNPGKREEYKHRKIFIADEARIAEHLPETIVSAAVDESANGDCLCDSTEEINHYELFMRKSCPNCPPVKEFCSKLEMTGEQLDVDSAEGFARASAYGIFSAPTVIFFDADGNEINRAHSVNEIKEVLSALYSGAGVLSAAI